MNSTQGMSLLDIVQKELRHTVKTTKGEEQKYYDNLLKSTQQSEGSKRTQGSVSSPKDASGSIDNEAR